SAYSLFPYPTLFRSPFLLLQRGLGVSALHDRAGQRLLRLGDLLGELGLLLADPLGLGPHLLRVPAAPLLGLGAGGVADALGGQRSEEHTSELQSRFE